MNEAYEIKASETKESIVAHRHSPKIGRNTVCVPGKVRRQRARNWCFTLNNYTKKDIDTMAQPNSKITKYIFQEEISKTGTEHLQGVICLKNPAGLSAVRKIHPKAHWEISKNWNASKNYCSKQESRNGRLWKKGCGENRSVKPKLSWEEILESRKRFLVEETVKNLVEVCMKVGHENCCKCRTKPLVGPTDPLPSVGLDKCALTPENDMEVLEDNGCSINVSA